MRYFHGTNISNLSMLLPSSETGNLREDFRKKFTDVVFITTSERSAEKYAYKAVAKSGGKPILYEVIPDFSTLSKMHSNEYSTEYAKVIQETKIP